MKNLLLTILLTLTPLMAHKSATLKAYKDNPFLKKDNFPGGYSLLPNSLPPLVGIYMMGQGQQKLQTTQKQHKVFEDRFNFMFKEFHKIAKEIRTLETQVMEKVVYQGLTTKQVKKQLDEIASKKRYLTQLQLECINIFKNTLSKQQYDQILKITKNFKKPNKK